MAPVKDEENIRLLRILSAVGGFIRRTAEYCLSGSASVLIGMYYGKAYLTLPVQIEVWVKIIFTLIFIVSLFFSFDKGLGIVLNLLKRISNINEQQKQKDAEK